MSGRRRLVVALTGAAGLGAAVVVAVVVLGSSDGGAAPAARMTGTAVVERRDLVDVDEQDGTLGYAGVRDVVNRLSGTITWLPPAGRIVRVDQRLFAVDGEPVVLLSGRRPAYRTLSATVSDGADVEQLERNLRARGYADGTGMDVDRAWDAGTTVAVERWQKAHGLEQTGTVELGRVAFLPGTRRRVAEVSATLGGSAASGGVGDASWDGGGGTFVPVVDTTATTPTTTITTPTTTPTTTTPTTTTPAPPRTTPRTTPTTTTPAPAPRADGAAATPSGGGDAASGGDGGGTGGDGEGDGGDDGGAATTVMTTTAVRREVVVDLDAAEQEMARRGDTVTVELPDGASVRGTITSVGRVATVPDDEGGGDPGAESGDPTVKVTVRLRRDRGSRLDQAPVTVRFARSRRRDVLAVPVTAILAIPGNRFAVERIGAAGRTLVPVETGLSADGYVEVSGAGIRAGMRVADAEETG